MGSIHPVWLIVSAALLALVPVLAAMLTSYLKVSVVLGMLRNALGTQHVPDAVTTMALALGISVWIMGPVFQDSLNKVGTLSLTDLERRPTLAALEKFAPALEPWRAFLKTHAGEREVKALEALDQRPGQVDVTPDPKQPLSMRLLIPAFVLSEIKEAFAMAFVLLLPFVVIDLIVANLLVGLGMTMVSPTMMSLPLKLLLFISVDGWLLLTRSLILSYQGS